MVKKIAFFTSLMLFSSVLSFAQIRSYVPIVRPVISKETGSFFTELGSSMKRIGYDELYEYFKAFSEGGYGSGFVYVASDRTNYVITNYHVIAGAESVKLEFEKEDGTMKTYENCRVLAWDDSIDLAIVSFPEGEKPFSAGLNFSSRVLEDGMDVWTAGYPGLGKDPMWQLGKGNITNSRARIADLIDPAITALIQHSAQVDAGNSGGPLLVINRENTGGYDVIGINTWKFVGRQATNYSIPSPVIRKFIDNARGQSGVKSGETKEALEARSKEFVSMLALGSEELKLRKMIDYISPDCMLEMGKTAMNKVLTEAPESVCKEILTSLSGFSPFMGIRMAIVYYYYMNIAEKKAAAEVSFVAVDWESRDSLGNISVRCLVKGKEVTTLWRLDNGRWKLIAFPIVSVVADSESEDGREESSGDSIFDFPFKVTVGLGTILPHRAISGLAWYAFAYWTFFDFISFGGDIGTWFESGGMDGLGLLGDLAVRLQLPMKNDFSTITPYLALLSGYELSSGVIDYSGLGVVRLSAGIQMAFGKRPGFVFGGEYQIGLANASNTTGDFSRINFYIGFGL